MKALKILVASLVSTCLTVSAMAEVAQPAIATPSTETIVFNNHLDTADLNSAFGGSQDLQVQAMTSQEMDETEGAIAPAYALGVFMMGTGRFIATKYVSRKERFIFRKNKSVSFTESTF